MNLFSTVEQDYFEHLNRFLLLIEPIIEDLERRNSFSFSIKQALIRTCIP